MPPDRPAPTAGRYHRPGDAWPLYASLETATVWAEWSAATSGAIDPRDERRRLWPIDVADLPVLDLRRPQARAALGVSAAELTGPRHAAQAVAGRARELGALGMIVPSAARDGAWNIVVFPDGFDCLTAGRARTMNPRVPGRRAVAVTPRAAGG